jgi:hypothetical protein
MREEYVCMHECIYTCMHECIYTCMHVCTHICYVLVSPLHASTPYIHTRCMYIRIHVYVCVCKMMMSFICSCRNKKVSYTVCVCMYTCMCVCVFVCVYVCMRMYIHTYVCIYIHIHTYERMKCVCMNSMMARIVRRAEGCLGGMYVCMYVCIYVCMYVCMHSMMARIVRRTEGCLGGILSPTHLLQLLDVLPQLCHIQQSLVALLRDLSQLLLAYFELVHRLCEVLKSVAYIHVRTCLQRDYNRGHTSAERDFRRWREDLLEFNFHCRVLGWGARNHVDRARATAAATAPVSLSRARLAREPPQCMHLSLTESIRI